MGIGARPVITDHKLNTTFVGSTKVTRRQLDLFIHTPSHTQVIGFLERVTLDPMCFIIYCRIRNGAIRLAVYAQCAYTDVTHCVRALRVDTVLVSPMTDVQGM